MRIVTHYAITTSSLELQSFLRSCVAAVPTTEVPTTEVPTQSPPDLQSFLFTGVSVSTTGLSGAAAAEAVEAAAQTAAQTAAAWHFPAPSPSCSPSSVQPSPSLSTPSHALSTPSPLRRETTSPSSFRRRLF